MHLQYKYNRINFRIGAHSTCIGCVFNNAEALIRKWTATGGRICQWVELSMSCGCYCVRIRHCPSGLLVFVAGEETFSNRMRRRRCTLCSEPNGAERGNSAPRSLQVARDSLTAVWCRWRPSDMLHNRVLGVRYSMIFAYDRTAEHFTLAPVARAVYSWRHSTTRHAR